MNEVIVRADKRGRLQYTEEQRTVLLEAFEASGLSGPRFAVLHGVKYQTLAGWIYRRKRTSGARRLAGPVSWVPAQLEVPPSNTTLDVSLPGDAKLHLADARHARLAAVLLHELSQLRPC